MPVGSSTTTSARPAQSRSPSTAPAASSGNDDPQAHVSLLAQKRDTRPSIGNIPTSRAASLSANDRLAPHLAGMKQQRLLAAADRKKRLITRLISIVGLLIILLCAGIVALTLKMAPKIDELVRTKGSAHPSVHLQARVPTPSTAPQEFNHSLTNSSSL